MIKLQFNTLWYDCDILQDIVILRFIPGGDEEKTHYINLYSYLNSRARCGVVGNKAKHIKDFYILPLASHSQIPTVLKPFDGPGMLHLVIGYICTLVMNKECIVQFPLFFNQA